MTGPAEDTVEIKLPLPAALLARVDTMAAATGCGRAEVIANAIVRMVAEHEERATGEAAALSDGEGEPSGPTYFSGG